MSSQQNEVKYSSLIAKTTAVVSTIASSKLLDETKVRLLDRNGAPITAFLASADWMVLQSDSLLVQMKDNGALETAFLASADWVVPQSERISKAYISATDKRYLHGLLAKVNDSALLADCVVYLEVVKEHAQRGELNAAESAAAVALLHQTVAANLDASMWESPTSVKSITTSMSSIARTKVAGRDTKLVMLSKLQAVEAGTHATTAVMHVKAPIASIADADNNTAAAMMPPKDHTSHGIMTVLLLLLLLVLLVVVKLSARR